MRSGALRTLFITKEVPYPPGGGVSLRNWQNMNAMMEFGPVAVFSAANWTPKETSLPGIEQWKHCNVERQRSSWENVERRLWWIDPLRHPDADWAYSDGAAEELDVFLAEFKPDLVIFEEVWLHRYLPVVKRHNCFTILDEHNVEAHLFEQRNDSNPTLREKLKWTIQLAHLRSIEDKFSRRVDRVWVCSEGDASLMEELYGDSVITNVVPNAIDLRYYDSVRLEQQIIPAGLEDKRRNLLFLGQMSYLPNTEAVKLLIDKIYPQIKKIYPDCRLLLVGRRPYQYMLDAAQKEPGIIITGTVPDVRPYLAAAGIMLVPLLKGGGTRFKILEAFASGCPVVSTAKGAEGLKIKDGEHLLIRDGIEEMVEGVCQIWSDPPLGKKLAETGYNLAKQEYSWEAVRRKIERAVAELI